jgi:hypothetical protein
MDKFIIALIVVGIIGLVFSIVPGIGYFGRGTTVRSGFRSYTQPGNFSTQDVNPDIQLQEPGTSVMNSALTLLRSGLWIVVVALAFMLSRQKGQKR